MTGMGNGERSNAYKEYTRNMSDLTPRLSESDFLASENIVPASFPSPPCEEDQASAGRLREYLDRNHHHSPQGRDNLKTSSFIPCCPGGIIEIDDIKSEVGTCKVCKKEVFVGPTLEFSPPPTETVTAEAERLTQAARHHSYGHPADDFAKVTGMALALWGRGPETPKEHAMYLILVKLSREAHEHKRDNLVDICGYARTIEMIMERESGTV